MTDATPLGSLKTCYLCRKQLERSEFFADRSRVDGLRPDCKECKRGKDRQWAAANRDKKRARQRRYVAANREKRLAANRAWAKENQDLVLDLQAKWRANNRDYYAEWCARNPGKRQEYVRIRRAREVSAAVGAVDLAALWDASAGLCGICREALDPNRKHPDPLSRSVDHIVPLSRGGTHEQSNLQWAHLVCNIRKGAKLADP